MTTRTLSFAGTHFAARATATRARKENLLAVAFAVFAAAVLSLTMLPPQPQSDPSDIDALQIIAGP